ncbi:hypothetical protein PHYBOEH_000726 [Phytophthora boehmeriae]|uniref:Temptin Cys/Cys disulfide domain-containing protein n=1 Tax=Phytophthora boehmeriae TaxID=109152 RepID=A0A8T1WUE7_9STRA|nr:hypothetical protein PHYBOEH_000726 [Phytophthora boehmeriae]
MKSFVAFTATALIIAVTCDSAMGLAKYLDELPNGSSFAQDLGHPDKDSSQYTDFATAFADAGHSWSAEFCKATFPGASMTNGAAFGDPCCTWTKGGTPDFTVTAFTTTPRQGDGMRVGSINCRFDCCLQRCFYGRQLDDDGCTCLGGCPISRCVY